MLSKSMATSRTSTQPCTQMSHAERERRRLVFYVSHQLRLNHCKAASPIKQMPHEEKELGV